MLRRIDGTVLSARAAEADGEVGESAFHVALHGSVDKGVGVLQEDGDFPVFFQETDDGFVQSGERLVALILAGVVHGAAVEHKAATVAGGVFGNSFLIGKAGDFHGELALLQVVRELLQFGQLAQYPAKVRIFGIGILQQLAEVLDGERHALDEVGLLLEIAPEPVGTQYLYVQFDALFTDGLYFKIGAYAIEKAERLKRMFREKGYSFSLNSPTNQQFILLDDEKAEKLRTKVRFSLWEKPDDKHTVARFCTSWATTDEELDELEGLL